MILKGSQRGGAKQLAVHLLKTQENEHVEIHELRGFLSGDLKCALHEAYAVSRGTRCKQFLFSLSLNPPEKESVPVNVFEEAIEAIEKKLGLEGQPRAVVFHEKEGRRHAHCVWSRIRTDTMTAVNLPHYKLKLRDISRALYLEHRWQMPRGLMNSKERNPLNFSHAEWQQARRTDQDPRAIKAMFQECWAVSDSGKAFVQALKERGYMMARGDRRGFVAMDFRGEVYAVSRYAGVRAKDVKAKLGDPNNLPSVADAKAKIAVRMTPVVKGYIREVEAGFRQQSAGLISRRSATTRQHREERQALDECQEQRRAAETRQRMLRLPKGFKGLWTRLTGKYGRIRRQNEIEAYKAYLRDQKQRQKLIDRQLEERRALQEDIREARAQHTAEIAQLQQDVAHYMSLGGREPALAREPFREATRSKDQSRRPDLGCGIEQEPQW